MNHKISQLFQAYSDGLQCHLLNAHDRSLEDAHNLGQRALAQGMKTLDLAKLHEEALINVAYHSNATNAKVSIRKLADLVRVEIRDDGIRLDVEESTRSEVSDRLGLLGMSERVEMIVGHFLILSERGKETTIQADIPYAHAYQSTTIPV